MDSRLRGNDGVSRGGKGVAGVVGVWGLGW